MVFYAVLEVYNRYIIVLNITMKKIIFIIVVIMYLFIAWINYSESAQVLTQARLSTAYNSEYEEMEYVGRAWATLWLSQSLGLSSKYQYNSNIDSMTWQAVELTGVLKFLDNIYLSGGWQSVWNNKYIILNDKSEWQQEDYLVIDLSYRSQPESFTGVTLYRNLDREMTLVKFEGDLQIPIYEKTSLYFEGNGKYAHYDNDIFSGLLDASVLGGILYTLHDSYNLTARILPYLEYRFPLTDEAENVFNLQNRWLVGLRIYSWWTVKK